jgi:hypothetical protein
MAAVIEAFAIVLQSNSTLCALSAMTGLSEPTLRLKLNSFIHYGIIVDVLFLTKVSVADEVFSLYVYFGPPPPPSSHTGTYTVGEDCY